VTTIISGKKLVREHLLHACGDRRMRARVSKRESKSSRKLSLTLKLKVYKNQLTLFVSSNF
jgi:hypothetical protein